jgi:hypothetical protein
VQPIRDAEVWKSSASGTSAVRDWRSGCREDTIMPVTAMGGRFKNAAVAYEQRDVMMGDVLACWAACQTACAGWTWTT